jgi:hypothetical protein
MAFPLGLAASPVPPAQLRALGGAYANCYPGDLGRLLQSYQTQVQRLRAELG